MVTRKSKAVIMVGDGAGGMAPVVDRRFDRGEWPIRFTVPAAEADSWLQYFSAECLKAGWNFNSIGQAGSKANSGSISVIMGSDQAQLAVVWERNKRRALSVRAASASTSELPLNEARQFLDRVNERCRNQVKERFYLRGQLGYYGSAWLGEVWLDDCTCLSKPSRHGPINALDLPRVILVDADVKGIDVHDAQQALTVKLREVQVFLTVILGHDVRIPRHGQQVWTWAQNPSGELECDIRGVGYLETERLTEMPVRGRQEPIAFRQITRPDFALHPIDWTYLGEKPPADVVTLWQQLHELAPKLRMQFFQVGALWQLAISQRQDYPTTSYALMVAACEALKPLSEEFKDHNFYHVLEATLGPAAATHVKSFPFPPHVVRNANLHGAKFMGRELMHSPMMSTWDDPTFRATLMDMSRITQAVIIDWLIRGGLLSMPQLMRKTPARRQ